MKKKLINSQLSNFKTYDMYRRQLLTLAENVFEFKNLPEFIDVSYLNMNLLKKGAIAFFKDEVMGVIALPYTSIGTLDIYGRPNRIQVISQNGYNKTLERDEYVLMFDNNGRYPLWLDILQYAERLALCTRVGDINLGQQKTPRFWRVPQEKEKTLKDLLNNVDGFEDAVTSYEGLNLEEIQSVLVPAPYITDKVMLDKDRIYNEFLRLIGIANLSYQKKERNISDEIQAMQGGTIASRYSRFEPREKAVKQINEKFGTKIEVSYYDGIPSSVKELESEVDSNADDTILQQ